MKNSVRKITTIVFEPDGVRVRTAPGITLLQAARETGVGIKSECGQKGICGKCRVVVRDKRALTKLTEAEIKHLASSEINLGYRLACQSIVKQNVVVVIPPESMVGARKIQVTGLERVVSLNPLVKKFHVKLPKPTLFDVRPDLERLLSYLKDTYNFENLEIDYEVLKELPDILRDSDWDVTATIWGSQRIITVEEGDTSNKLYGLAIDVGTSKIVVYVVDLTTGKTVGVGAIENPQVVCGEDIISRITLAMTNNEKLKLLQKLVVEGINEALGYACTETNIIQNNIYEAAIVGNTAMHHILLGIQPKYLALSPFTPAARRSIDIKAEELKIKMHPNGVLHVLPVVAGFVGGDAVGDVLASGIHESEELSLLLDIGTNTEVFVGNSEDILSCSCASGPAFEGAHIKHGMKAVTGAIEKIHIDPDSYEVKYETIGDVKPLGLCGSAMVDVVAEMLKCGIINSHGRLNPNIKTPRLRVANNTTEFILVWGNETMTGREIVVTQKDINEIQLAKAAIFTGCTILMMKKNVRREDLDQVFIAGAFGNYINPENAKFIGLVPDVPTKKIKFVGNTAVTGAKMVLISSEARENAEMLSKKVRYLELAADPDFHLEFFNAMLIPHKDLNKFPSVKEYLGKRVGKVVG